MEQPESNPTFCTNNCGFYGSSQFEGMCSKCYREHVSRSLNTGRASSCNSMFNICPYHNKKKTMNFSFRLLYFFQYSCDLIFSNTSKGFLAVIFISPLSLRCILSSEHARKFLLFLA